MNESPENVVRPQESVLTYSRPHDIGGGVTDLSSTGGGYSHDSFLRRQLAHLGSCMPHYASSASGLLCHCESAVLSPNLPHAVVPSPYMLLWTVMMGTNQKRARAYVSIDNANGKFRSYGLFTVHTSDRAEITPRTACFVRTLTLLRLHCRHPFLDL